MEDFVASVTACSLRLKMWEIADFPVMDDKIFSLSIKKEIHFLCLLNLSLYLLTTTLKTFPFSHRSYFIIVKF